VAIALTIRAKAVTRVIRKKAQAEDADVAGVADAGVEAAEETPQLVRRPGLSGPARWRT
jgi:hypothetical protein